MAKEPLYVGHDKAKGGLIDAVYAYMKEGRGAVYMHTSTVRMKAEEPKGRGAVYAYMKHGKGAIICRAR